MIDPTWKWNSTKCGLEQGYGMTEAGVLTMCLGFAKKPYKFKSGSCGSVIRNARMKIVDPLTRASLQRNQTGEICVKGDQVTKGIRHIYYIIKFQLQ